MRLPRAAALTVLAGALMSTAATPNPAALHRAAVVVDLHSDAVLDVASGKRDLAVRSSTGHLDIPRMRRGGVDVQVFALFIHPRFAGQGFRRATELLDAFDGLVQANTRVLARTTAIAEIEQAVRAGRIAAVLAVENASAIDGDIANVDRLYARGVRMMSLTWNRNNDLAGGALDEDGGLTPLGRRVLARMEQLGMVVDVSHLSERSFWDVLGATTSRIVATHSNAAGLTAHRRNLTDDQLRAIARRGGVVGVNFYPEFTGGATLRHVLDHVDYLVKVTGADHVALGSDFDGFSQRVEGLEDVSRLPALTAGLLGRGYAPEDVRKILGGNALRVFRSAWK